ncbi:class II glutamine amidotransferase [Kiloniella laminariae]|uniref:Class II glutamine amidotransferase n=1 Tax=Kiloniella laminariae TaxID=454162 RepID=A0ABT4LG35_9PROT|nr:class II glutamine amidotransferase [Kiloniella laminariae]MCZ4279900.1 class II glutamine amidotransferase [Kiloniella laminariae]
MFTLPPLLSDILAISFDGRGSPSININLPNQDGDSTSHGWGFGWYPDDHKSSMVAKDPAARGNQVLVDAITEWSNFRSTVFFSKIHGASKGYSHRETQPFSRSFAGRDWLFMHNGHLDKAKLAELHGEQSRLLEPLGSTDSELAFCDILAQLQRGNARRISDVDPTVLHGWFLRFDGIGSSDMYITDGDSIACFHGSLSPKPLCYTRIQPPDNRDSYVSPAAEVILNDPRDTYRTALVVSSSPFTNGAWVDMQPGQMIVIRRGSVIWDSAPVANPAIQKFAAPTQHSQPQQKNKPGTGSMAAVGGEQAQEHVTNVRTKTRTDDGMPLGYRLFEVKHSTHYEYTDPVEHSTHFFRLQPTDDPVQEVVQSRISISSPAEKIQFEDVFGNQSLHCIINTAYNKLTVESVSRVKIFARPPDDHGLSRRQTTIPMVWMPWQRQMMMPYLLPSELPESQLTEMTEYAMSFVERNDYHLLRTLEDMNVSIYRDYKYVPGTTSLNTTPFEVYTSRQGVCQDFANLFICLARLLNIPARYRMGYIYTGANYANKIQSDASHAWAEIYLPFVGWRGFDPTNGCAVTQDHIRVACGRNYRDATPTSGTIYKGGGGLETLKVDVKMEEIHEE